MNNHAILNNSNVLSEFYDIYIYCNDIIYSNIIAIAIYIKIKPVKYIDTANYKYGI